MTEPSELSSSPPPADSVNGGSGLLRSRPRLRGILATSALGLGLVGLAAPVPWGDFAMIGTLIVALLWALFEGIWWLIERVGSGQARP